MPDRLRLRATDVPAESVDRRSFVRNYLLANAYEAALALAAVASSLTYFFAPQTLEQSSVAGSVHGLAYLWSAMYGMAGLLILAGMLTRSLRRELAGLSLLTGALLVNVTAILGVRGIQGASTAITFLGLIAASAARAWLIVKLVRRAPGGG